MRWCLPCPIHRFNPSEPHPVATQGYQLRLEQNPQTASRGLVGTLLKGKTPNGSCGFVVSLTVGKLTGQHGGSKEVSLGEPLAKAMGLPEFD